PTTTDGWEGLTVTVTKPDGTTETLGPYRTDSTGITGDIYVPNQVGTYYLQTHFPEQMRNWTVPAILDPALFGPILYKASDSEILELVVQEEQLPLYPGFQLPTEYWTRPIDAQIREWSTIAGNWLTVPDNRFAPYNEGPETAHILWAKPITMGGLVGGELGPQGFECGDAYEGKFASSVIIGGILFYNRYAVTFGDVPIEIQQGIVAVDLRTGEELWFRNNTRLAFGQTFYWDSYNFHGVFDYLWETVAPRPYAPASTWNAYDTFTGEWVYTMTNVPSGTNIYGPKGEIYRYTLNLEEGWMTMWNSSRVGSSGGSWGSSVHHRTLDATLGIEWNVTIPTGLPEVSIKTLEDRIIGANIGDMASVMSDPLELWSISTAPGSEGELLYHTTWNQPTDQGTRWAAWSLEDRVGVIFVRELRQYYGFSLDTGKLLWGPTASQPYLDRFYMTRTEIAYGKLFSVGIGGVVHAYDVTTGKLLWTYEAEDAYNEILWANNWWSHMVFITDGKIYLGHLEHSPMDPKPRGAPFYCLDVETGEEIWRADGLFRSAHYGGRAIIGDSIIATMDTY
ncbi:MAG: PQQ-binding-like beta-propeller repeat protein, partial [Desulfobacterales bacterium]|nr:PQQ-binding-like beta-propeller repeat protein [Desulfobacterales bacterium]